MTSPQSQSGAWCVHLLARFIRITFNRLSNAQNHVNIAEFVDYWRLGLTVAASTSIAPFPAPAAASLLLLLPMLQHKLIQTSCVYSAIVRRRVDAKKRQAADSGE